MTTNLHHYLTPGSTLDGRRVHGRLGTENAAAMMFVFCLRVGDRARLSVGGLGSCTSCNKHTAIVKEGKKEMFYLTTHSTHFIYGYMASDIWLRTILTVRKETRCYSFRLTARVLLYAPSHRQDNKYHGLCYTSRGALAGTT